MEQNVTINEIIFTPPTGVHINDEEIPKFLKDVEKALSPVVTIDGDIDVIFTGADTIGICCDAINERADISPEEVWVGDPECTYGEGKEIDLNATDFIDRDDLKKALQKAFPDWDIDIFDVDFETPEDMYERCNE